MMIARLLKATDFHMFLTFVSPTFFKVVPAGALARKAKELANGYRDPQAFGSVCDLRRATLSGALPRIGLALPGTETGGEPAEAAPGFPDDIVELFFHQLFTDEWVLADLRGEVFTADGDRTMWRPSPVFATWSPDFLAPLRSLYRGFYGGDDAEFRAALADLNLAASEQVFRRHFGSDQDHVRFVMSDFVSTFHQVFVNCKAVGVSLHSDFIVLGIYLASLYQNLERFDQGVDVRAAFGRATAPRVHSDTRKDQTSV
jgi:hypothetical protein